MKISVTKGKQGKSEEEIEEGSKGGRTITGGRGGRKYAAEGDQGRESCEGPQRQTNASATT